MLRFALPLTIRVKIPAVSRYALHFDELILVPRYFAFDCHRHFQEENVDDFVRVVEFADRDIAQRN